MLYLLFDRDVLYPYLSWMTTFCSVFLVQYINQPFSDQIPAFPMYWPIFYFFLFPDSLFFSSALLFPFPISSFSLCVHRPLLVCSQMPAPPVLSFIPCPCLHPVSIPMFMLLCLNKCSSDQLAPINRLEPLTMTTSPFCGNHPSLWMICSSPLFLDSSLFCLTLLALLSSKDGYAPKSVYPLRYVIVSTILLLLIWFFVSP